ncbi:hypothetical protein L1987_08406 [Smallanthus sonchifolius]|uniref:Uncharacterized protein n=1 Tax=Smallanthus sonchifolius TaxID=185202 RepID=A0ACB9JMA2_9ASTR|nr:hypothetical protein L1987_08406 [Smallanthus sonchifolius]
MKLPKSELTGSGKMIPNRNRRPCNSSPSIPSSNRWGLTAIEETQFQRRTFGGVRRGAAMGGRPTGDGHLMKKSPQTARQWGIYLMAGRRCDGTEMVVVTGGGGGRRCDGGGARD